MCPAIFVRHDCFPTVQWKSKRGRADTRVCLYDFNLAHTRFANLSYRQNWVDFLCIK